MRNFFKDVLFFVCLLAILLLLGCAGTNGIGSDTQWDVEDSHKVSKKQPSSPPPAGNGQGQQAPGNEAIGDYNSDGQLDLALIKLVNQKNELKVLFGTNGPGTKAVEIAAKPTQVINGVQTFPDVSGDLILLEVMENNQKQEYLIDKEILHNYFQFPTPGNEPVNLSDVATKV